jgi:hypothetical protein
MHPPVWFVPRVVNLPDHPEQVFVSTGFMDAMQVAMVEATESGLGSRLVGTCQPDEYCVFDFDEEGKYASAHITTDMSCYKMCLLQPPKKNVDGEEVS